MTSRDRPVLTDPAQPPTPALIQATLGKSAPLWDDLWARVRETHPELSPEWRYYADGKSWLMKVAHGSRTICWVFVGSGGFRVTTYFPPRAEQTIVRSSLPPTLQTQFLDADPNARTRAITVDVCDDDDVAAAKQLIALRDRSR